MVRLGALIVAWNKSAEDHCSSDPAIAGAGHGDGPPSEKPSKPTRPDASGRRRIALRLKPSKLLLANAIAKFAYACAAASNPPAPSNTKTARSRSGSFGRITREGNRILVLADCQLLTDHLGIDLRCSECEIEDYQGNGAIRAMVR